MNEIICLEQVFILDLTESQICTMEKLFHSVWISNQAPEDDGIIYDDIDFRLMQRESSKGSNRESNLGSVFFALDRAGTILGYIFGLDSTAFKKERAFPRYFIAKNLIHEHQFIQDLLGFGPFTFINQFCIRKSSRRKGVGRDLMQFYLDFYRANHPDVVLAGSVAHEKNPSILHWMKNNFPKVLFLDSYLTKDNNGTTNLWHRMVLVLQDQAFYDKILDNISDTYRTAISIQLNRSAQVVNRILEPYNAKVVWASFFQRGEFDGYSGMDKSRVFSSFYNSLLGEKDEYIKASLAIKKYLSSIESFGGDAFIPMAKSMKGDNKGYQFFLLDELPDQELTKYEFPDFPKPVPYDFSSLSLRSLIIDTNLGIGTIIEDSKTRNKLIDALRLKAIASKFHAEGKFLEEKKLISDWKKAGMYLDDEVDQILDYIRKEKGKINLNKSPSRIKKLFFRRKIDAKEQGLWGNWIENHKAFLAADQVWLNNRQTKRWCHAIIPMSFAEGVHGVMFTLVFDPLKGGQQLLNDLAINIQSALSRNLFNIIIRLQLVKKERALLKNAISTISTRNLAHSFGSHVLAKIASPRILWESLSEAPLRFDQESKLLAGVMSLARFNVYVRTRMDLLADISTSEPVSSMTMNLDSEVLEAFRQNDIITRYIAGIRLDEKIEINFKNNIGDDLEEDVLIQVPNANLGVHAFFQILENVARNSAKHSKEHIPEDVGLELYVTVEKPHKNYASLRSYRILIHDNIPRFLSEIKDDLNRINKLIDAQTVIKGRHIRRDGWGLSEMKIAAAYLRKKSPSRHIQLLVRPPLLRAVKVEIPTPKGSKENPRAPRKFYLGYELYLKQPRQIIIYDSEGLLISDRNKEDWNHLGIKILQGTEYGGQARNQTHSNDIMIHFSKIKREEVEINKNMPLRWVFIPKLADQLAFKALLEKDTNLGVDYCWMLWLKTYIKNKDFENVFIPILKDDRGFNEDLQLRKEALIQEINPAHLILFDLHGSLASSGKIDPSKLAFYESASGISPTARLIRENSNKETVLGSRLGFELIEAGITDVIIIDERVQEELVNTDVGINGFKATRFDVLKWMRIFVPTLEDIDLYQETFTKIEKTKFESWLAEKLNSRKIDFCVLHLGLIEKIVGDSRVEAIEAYLKKIIIDIDDRPEIVITSGRGKPHELPQKTLFLNYSNISKYVLEETSKFNLVKVLFSARSRENVNV